MDLTPARQATRARASVRRLASLLAASVAGILCGCVEQPAATPPSILLITIDTLRADHTTPYGYQRRTTPHIQRRLADRGAVLEHAYAPAPWTLPSMSALFAGRYPNELVGESLTGFGIPPEITPLAERLAAAGYTTAAFNANPTMHEGNGFARGFDTFYAPDVDAAWVRRNAADVGRRAIDWLRRNQDRRFFLWVHFLDPHDPYLAPQLVDGRSDFYPDYAGPVRGDWPDRLYSGKIRRELEPADVRQLAALYDSEIRHTDTWVGKLLAALEPEVERETFIVLTSDHGEELYEHGGLKHGQTLFEEQIHVPMVVRWDGRVEPGLRLLGEVMLIDLFPTLLDLARARPDPATDGVTVLPALRGEEKLPWRPLVAQNLSPGPRRFAVISRRQKLFVFDRYASFSTSSPLYTWLWRQDVERLERSMLFDLRSDPGETNNLAANQLTAVRSSGRLGHQQVLRQLHGLRMLVGSVPEKARVVGTVRFERPPAAVERYFLTAADTVEQTGADLRFELTGGALDKGVLIRGDVGALHEVRARIVGFPETRLRILVGEGPTDAEGPVPSASLDAGPWPPPPDGPWLRIWRQRQEPPTPSPAEEDPETLRRLRALGYVD